MRERTTSEMVVRDADTAFELRWDQFSQAIDPETFRVVYQGRIYEIVGKSEGKARADTLVLLTAFRPDMRGERAPVEESG